MHRRCHVARPEEGEIPGSPANPLEPLRQRAEEGRLGRAGVWRPARAGPPGGGPSGPRPPAPCPGQLHAPQSTAAPSGVQQVPQGRHSVFMPVASVATQAPANGIVQAAPAAQDM